MEEGIIKLENEDLLVEKAKSDDAAFEQLYYHYFPKIYSYVMKRVGSRETAEDIVSDVFTKAFANLKKYQSRGFSFGAWLYRIATNALTDHYRKQARHPELKDDDAMEREPSHNSTEEQAKTNSDRAAIEKVLVRLPERYSQAVYLRYFAEMEIYEVAEVMKVSKAHASVLIHRALESFKREAARTGIKFFCFLFL
jgi:RNA polymerase sigma-70 factor, ECF subfamily